MRAIESEVTVINRHGLHARPSAKLVETANHFQSRISIFYGDHEVNAKSIMSLLTLGAPNGARLKLKAEGPDQESAMKAILSLVRNGFGEPS